MYAPSVISTHTPHARRDRNAKKTRAAEMISTHTPHARRDRSHRNPAQRCGQFLLTRLMRGVTTAAADRLKKHKISTHTPPARRDLPPTSRPLTSQFLLTRLMRGVTAPHRALAVDIIISTHTPHARRDYVNGRGTIRGYNFYSHASCEA